MSVDTSDGLADFEPEVVDDEALGNFAQIAMVDAEDLMSECELEGKALSGSSEQLDELLNEFDDVFSGLGHTHMIEHKSSWSTDAEYQSLIPKALSFTHF